MSSIIAAMLAKHLKLLALITIALVGCADSKRDLTVYEAVDLVPTSRPLYAPQAEFDEQAVETSYWITDTSEGIIYADFFLKDSDGESVNVMSLMSCSACAPIGRPGQLTGGSTFIGRPFNQEAYLCEPVKESEFVTCLFWMDSYFFSYMAYSTLSLDDTLRFLENLELAR
jgi:hypothetical protein